VVEASNEVGMGVGISILSLLWDLGSIVRFFPPSGIQGRALVENEFSAF